MQTQTQKLEEKNRLHRQRMLLLKTRTENGLKRPSPIVSSNASPNISYTYSNSIKNSSKPLTLQLLKQYQSNKTSSQADQSSDRGVDKSIDYNSTLFKYFKQESNLSEKDVINNGSSVSIQSARPSKDDNSYNDVYKDDSLLNKIDELLKKNQNKPKAGINQVYEQYLQKKTVSNSSGFSNNNSNFSNQLSSTNTKLKSNSASTYLQKLKTIEQEKLTLTIDREQLQQKKRNKKKQSQPIKLTQNKSGKKPPLAPTLSSTNTIERQKKKIQDTMQQIKKQQIYEFHDKDSLILELSDNESELEQKEAFKETNGDQNNKVNRKPLEKQKKQDRIQKQKKVSKLTEQKQHLMKQLSQICQQLQKLQQEQRQQQM